MKIFKQITANNIELKSYPFKRELAMEAYLIENEDILSLDNNNFTEVTVLDAEIALKNGRRDRNGRIDILCSYGAEYLSIVELKLESISEVTLNQLQEYLDEKEQILEIGKIDYWESEETPKWIGVLVGTSITPDLQKKLTEGHKHGDIPIAGIVINRYRGEDGNIFVVSDTYFSYKYSSKDYSKFTFNNQSYNKARLVNAVLRYYIESNPRTTFAVLKEKFPNQIQGSNLGVFDKLANAEEIYNGWGHKRHYIKSSETLILSDNEVIATCNQWNPKNISTFIKRAKEFGIDIKIQ